MDEVSGTFNVYVLSRVDGLDPLPPFLFFFFFSVCFFIVIVVVVVLLLLFFCLLGNSHDCLFLFLGFLGYSLHAASCFFFCLVFIRQWQTMRIATAATLQQMRTTAPGPGGRRLCTNKVGGVICVFASFVCLASLALCNPVVPSQIVFKIAYTYTSSMHVRIFSLGLAWFGWLAGLAWRGVAHRGDATDNLVLPD